MFLIINKKKNKADSLIIEGYGNDCYDLAVHSVRLDCCQQLPENKKYIKKLNEKLIGFINPYLSK